MAKIIAKNKNAYFNFVLETTFEAGIQLHGWEVKSIRATRVNLKGAFCSFRNDELFVSNIHIAQYMHIEGDETRPRKLLLHKSQIKKLKEWTKTKGRSIVPTVMKISKKGLVKIDVAMATGKNEIDKRETIKKRDIERRLKKYY